MDDETDRLLYDILDDTIPNMNTYIKSCFLDNLCDVYALIYAAMLHELVIISMPTGHAEIDHFSIASRR
jgi:hypothetical protein